MKLTLFRRLSAAALALCLTAGLSSSVHAYDAGTAGKDIYLDGDAYINTSHELWMKSHNQYGQLGIGVITPSDDRTYEDQWIKVMDDVASVCNASGITAAIKTDRSLWMWGLNNSNQLGFKGGNAPEGAGEYFAPCQTVPVKVMDDVAAVATSGVHTAAIKTDGSLWLWGSNAYGAIGDGKGDKVNSSQSAVLTDGPVKIMDDVVAVSCGNDFTAAVKTDGSLWAWGKNTDGRLGNNFLHNAEDGYSHLWQTTPVKVMDGVAGVSCGGGYVMIILKTDGTVWACGSHEYHTTGEDWTLAGGYYALRAQPVPIQITDNGAAVYSRADMAAVLKKDGSLWTWGRYYLGDGTRYSSYEPVLIAYDVADVSLSNDTFVKSDGTTWAWSFFYPVQYGSGILSRLRPVICANYEDRLYNMPQGLPVQPTAAPIPETGTASAARLTIHIKGEPVDFQAYALTDGEGRVTNYLRLRDLAQALNGTQAQFQVGWEDGYVTIMEDWRYTGSSGQVPFSGNQPYRRSSAPTRIDGVSVDLEAIILTDEDGNDYTYYKLRDLGKALDFNVTWDAETGITILTAQPYSDQ